MSEVNLRTKLGKLILDGCRGRTLEQLWWEVSRRFVDAGLTITRDTFIDWATGISFPANQMRQNLLGDAVGGAYGGAIKALQAPPFRGFRRRVMKEPDMKTHREFPLVMRVDEAGLLVKQAQISCAACPIKHHHLRRGSLESDDYFRRRGWDVGHNATHDFCPECAAAAKRKVVKMSDHKKPEPPVAAPDQPPVGADRRLVSHTIEAHWDEPNACYRVGWSDAKVQEDLGVPIAWVKQVREVDFPGSSGDDPTIAQFIAEQITVKAEMNELRKIFDELTTSVANINKLMVNYKDKYAKLHERTMHHSELAEKLKTPFHKAG